MDRIIDAILSVAEEIGADSTAAGPDWLSGRVTAQRSAENDVTITAAGRGAVFYEIGSRNQPPRPFLYPAYMARRGQIVEKAGQAAKDVLKEVLEGK